jgi:hypothetical protein
MPVFDQADYVVDAIESVLGQQGVIAEIIISDDGSSDGTFKVLFEHVMKRVHDKPPLHRIILRKGSLRLARDHLPLLADRASCDIVMQAHGDDISSIHRAQLVLKVFHKFPDVSMVVSAFLDMSPNGDSESIALDENTPIRIKWLAASQIIRGVKAIIGATQAWRRCQLAPFGRLDTAVAAVSHDKILSLRAVLGGRVGYVDLPLIKRRRHAEQWSKNMVSGLSHASSNFGWGLTLFYRYHAMAKEVQHAKAMGMVNDAQYGELIKLIAAHQNTYKMEMLRAFEELTRMGLRIQWVDEFPLRQ